MNYGQFLNMVPEYYLVLILLAVFVVDFIMHRSEKKCDVLFAVTAALLVVLPVRIVMLADPAEAFGGLYVATPAVNVMKAILAFGTLIVVLMAQPWVATRKQLAGEFYMLILSTLLGMFVMMSSGNFLMFFLGLEMASVPLACMVAFDKDRKNSAEGAAKYILVAQDLSRALPLLDSRHLSGCAHASHWLPQRHLQGCRSHHAVHHPDEGVPAAGGLLGASALHRHRPVYHRCQPLRHPSERTQALHGVQFYLSGRLHHVGSGG